MVNNILFFSHYKKKHAEKVGSVGWFQGLAGPRQPHWFESSRCGSVPIWNRHGGCCCLGCCLGHWMASVLAWPTRHTRNWVIWDPYFFPAASKQDLWHSKPFPPTGSFSEVRIWGKWCKPRRHPSHLLKLIQLANFAKSVTRGNPKQKPDLLTQFFGCYEALKHVTSLLGLGLPQ